MAPMFACLLGLLAFLVVLAAGCAGSEAPAASGAAVGGAVRTFGTTVARTPRATPLSVTEVRTFVVLGFDVREQPVIDPKQFDLESVHGPCGAAVATPYAPDKGVKVFRSTISLVVEAIADPGDEAATAFVDHLAADAKPGCPAFEERLGTAAPTQVQFLATMPTAGLGERSVAYEQSVTAADGTKTYRYVAVAAGGPRATMVAVLSPRQLGFDGLRPLFTRAIAG